MKVLQINAVSGIMSTGRTTNEIADYLNNNGHEGYIAYSEGLPYEKGYKIGTQLEKKLHALCSRIFGKQAYYSKKGTKNLIKYIGQIKPDIVHLNNLHSNYINLGMLLEYLSKEDIPTVVTLHDCWFYTGKCTHYTIENCYKWKTECDKCPQLKKDNKSWFFDYTNKMFRDKKEWFNKIPRLAVVGVSDWITNEAKSSFLSSASIITRIYNWIDLEVFKPVSTNKKEQISGIKDKFIILGVASGWTNEKGLNKFIELSKLIQEDKVILLIGRMKKNIKLPYNIIHIDETHDVNELVEYYSMADVFVNLSVQESFGKVTAEALACGTPVIVFNSTANPELVGYRCGYVVENNEITSILKYIKVVQRKGKAFYSDYCIKYAKDNFCKDNRIKDYINLYKKLKFG